ncbi:MAG: N-acetyl-alpha-D-glucosaminyl L-malate synthase BshA [Planctomycetaceae bacterium]|nr:N-acetyl-alpha-D-glucosaminyl L-malate synthase BshA [Planctomycetaceae bacterium]
MRIAISCHPTQGGSGVVATELAMALGDRDHDVHLVSDERPFRLDDDAPLEFHRVNVTDYPLFRYPPHDLCLANQLADLVIERDIQIIHAHYAVPHAVSAMLAADIVQPHPVKVVTTVHGTDITLVGSHHDFYRVCRHAMSRCDGLTAVSQWLCDRTQEEFDLPVAPHVIPNFVDCDRFTADNHDIDENTDELILLHASNFRPVKRVCDVVRVFAAVQHHTPARLMMVGDGPERGLAGELAAELGIADRVDFVGPQFDMGDVYRNAHIFLLLSDYESFGLSALEALACGTPVVASRSGGLIEVVEDHVTGRLCPVGQIQQIADAVLGIWADRAAWRQMSDTAPKAARRVYCKDKIVPQYEKFYEGILHAAQV